MFHIYELGEGDNYDTPPSKPSLALCMAVAKRCLSKSTNIEIPDMICSYGCEATEEDVEAAVLEKTGLRTPWIKYTLAEFVQNFERKADIVTWEMVPEANRTIAEKLACLKAAVAYMTEQGFEIVRSFSFSFQVVDSEDEIDDEAMADMVYLETGVRTEWYPYRVGDTEGPTVAGIVPVPPEILNLPTKALALPTTTPTLPTKTRALPTKTPVLPTKIPLALPTALPTDEVPALPTKIPALLTTLPTAEASALPTEIPALLTNTPALPTELPTKTLALPTDEALQLPTARPPRPIVCPACKMVFKNKHAKSDHKRRHKCSAGAMELSMNLDV